MKLILSTLLAAGLATTAFAGNSDRYNDLRFDTGVGHVTDTKDKAATAETLQTQRPVAFTTRSKTKQGKSYPYINPFGVGPYNDSR